ncbi:Cytoplasmic and mitochondrial histidine tRNA synthetase, partial [Coemansia helicoidea]
LWDNGIATEFAYKTNPRLATQYSACDADVIPWAVIIGKDELEKGVVLLKNMAEKDASQGNGAVIQRSEMVAELKKRLQA